jgi:hypothetical protein
LSASASWTDVALAAADGTNGNAGYSDNTKYVYTMEMKRTPSGELQVASSIVGGNLDGSGAMSVSATDATPQSFAFDTFALRPSSASTTTEQWDTYLFRVDYIPYVPEPTTFLLLGLGGAVLAMMRRRG